MVFNENSESNMDLDYPDLLRQKYYSSPQDGEVDMGLNAFISRAEDASEKMKEVLTCLEHYSDLYNKVRGSLGPEYS